MATRRRVKITNTPAPSQPRQVDRGGRRTSINSNILREDQKGLQYERGGFYGGEYTIPDQNARFWPKTLQENQNYQPISTTGIASESVEMGESWEFSQKLRDQGSFIPLTYYPTKTSWPANGWDHRRTIAAGYSKEREILRVQFFTDGAIYDYYDVSPHEAYMFRLTNSPGRFINDVLNGHSYQKIS